MAINASQGQRRPGELHGFEVNQGAGSSLPFDCLLIHWALGRRAMEDSHHLQGQAMNDVDAAIVKSQGQTWGEMITKAEQANSGITLTSPSKTATESTCGNNTAPKGLQAHSGLEATPALQKYASSHGNETGRAMPWKVSVSISHMCCSEFFLQLQFRRRGKVSGRNHIFKRKKTETPYPVQGRIWCRLPPSDQCL